MTRPTLEELAAWREACAKTTPGPWSVDESNRALAFIAVARDALPRLLDELATVTAERDAARAETERAWAVYYAEIEAHDRPGGGIP